MKIKQPVYLLALLAIIYTSCKKKSDLEEIKPAVPAVVVTPSKEKPSDTASVPSPVIPVTFEKADSLYNVESAAIKAMANFDHSLEPFKAISKYTVTIFKVQYKTTYQGRIISASGIVAVPKGTKASWPTLSYHHGTVFADNDAPTNNRGDQLVIAALASTGYIIAAPDYIGFGTSTGITHPYYVAEYAASASRDLLVATQEFLAQKKVSQNGKLFLAGYSQGGNVTMAVSKSIEAKPLAGYNLTASAVGAGGYNMEGIFANITGRKEYPSPNYIAYIIQSYRMSYNWDTPLTYYFKNPYAARIPSLINGKTESSEINNSLTIVFDSLIQPGFVTGVRTGSDKAFSEALKINSLHNWKPTRPLRIYHSDGDEVVPYSDSEFTYQTMLSAGSNSVSFVQIHGKSHGTAAIPMIAGVIEWFGTF